MVQEALVPPGFHDVLAAKRRIRPYLSPTPLIRAESLSDDLGFEVLLKLEFLHPTRAFKVRGGINLVAAEHEAGLLSGTGLAAASTGNHGQSVAYAGRLFGVPVRVFVPRDANPVKTRAMERLGATVVRIGRDFDAAREACEEYAAEHGWRYVHSMNEPLLIAGVATAYLEALTTAPDASVILVPMGGGTGASAAGLVASHVNPAIRVIGVQAEGAPALHHAFHTGTLAETPTMTTAAEGLATRVAFSLPLAMIRATLQDVRLVSDAELYAAQRLLLRHARVLPEMAGAAGLAAALQMRDALLGQRVILPLTGANASDGEISRVLAGIEP